MNTTSQGPTPPVRTDEQIIMADPFNLTFGGKKYPVKPLSVRRSREWRQKLSTMATGLIQQMEQSDPTNKSNIDRLFVESGDFFKVLLLQIPDQIYDLVFDYGVDLPRDEIMDTATEREMLAAFREVLVIAYPFASEFQMIQRMATLSRH